jgi:NAD(P)-dependent dehydrogenase (short-subunit alcohol dehydrogenase family)
MPLDPAWRIARVSAFAASNAPLEGRHIAVTRALSPIGRAQAMALTAAGARVTLLDVPALLADGKELMRDLTTSRFFGVDLQVSAEARRAAMHLAADDPVDVLVNNAAPDLKLPFRQLSPEEFEQQIRASCTTAFVMARAIAEGMKTRARGSIINLCAATHPGEWNGYVSYAASNGAIAGLTRSLAREFGSHGIRVNSISVGAMASLAEVRIFGDRLAEYDDWVIRNQCIKRRIRPEDVSDLVLFLASDRSSMITGQNIVIDGGW